jgi:hypothetical protein
LKTPVENKSGFNIGSNSSSHRVVTLKKNDFSTGAMQRHSSSKTRKPCSNNYVLQVTLTRTCLA